MKTIAHYMLESAIEGLIRTQCPPTAAGGITITKYKKGVPVSVQHMTVGQAGHHVDEYGYGAAYKLPGSK